MKYDGERFGLETVVGVSRLPQAEEDRERLPKKRRVLGDVKLVCGRCRACYFRDRISVRSRFYPADQVAKRHSFWRGFGARRDYRARRCPLGRRRGANRKLASDSRCIRAKWSVQSPQLQKRCPSEPERSASPIP